VIPASADPQSVPASDAATWHADARTRVRAVLEERVHYCRKATGAVAALIDADHTTIVACGAFGLEDARPVDEQTLFELGSIQKVLDGLLLSDMVQRGELDLNDPVERYLPPDIRLPRKHGPITLLHLVTHTSGLPGRRTMAEAEACVGSLDAVKEFVSTFTPSRAPGATYEYSNVGAQLLRCAAAARAGVDYESLLLARVTGPLGMDSTTLTPRPELMSRMAVGHNDRLVPVPANDAMLKSSARDLCALLRACVGGGAPAPVQRALDYMLAVRQPIGTGLDIALGWNVETHGRDEIVCHDGLSAGFRTWIGFRPSVRRGAVVLSNAASTAAMLDLGYHLLDPSYPLMTSDVPLLQPAQTPVAVAVAAEVLDRHIGRYQLTPNVFIEITRTGDRLFAQRTGRPRLEIHPESSLRFFCKEVEFWELPADTRIVFRQDEDGTTCGLTLRQRGQDVWVPRARDGGGGGVWFGHAPAAVDTAVLARYVGRYRLRSTILAICSDANGLVAEFDAGLRARLVPSGEARFFIPNDISHVELAFELDPEGRAVGVTVVYDALADAGVRLP
jgi:D-alanyl-D-alanine-carboxypeptidase/D-alanyl-D-alanine-endopeptidase